MWCSRSFRTGAAAAALATLCAADAAAQSGVGSQWLTAGLSLSPMLAVDKTAPQVGVAKVAVGGGLRARLGFQHVVSAPFVMAAELELGNTYLGPSTIAADGHSSGGGGFAWQAGLIGRWVPRSNMTGPSFGLGLHTYRAKLPETPLQSLSGDLRFGWYLWRGEKFVLAEVGYAIPFLDGVDAPTAFDGAAPAIADKNWRLHRVAFGFSYGF